MSRYDTSGIDGYSEMLFALKEKSIFKCECGDQMAMTSVW